MVFDKIWRYFQEKPVKAKNYVASQDSTLASAPLRLLVPKKLIDRNMLFVSALPAYPCIMVWMFTRYRRLRCNVSTFSVVMKRQVIGISGRGGDGRMHHSCNGRQSLNINATSSREKLVDVQGGEGVAHGCLTKARNHKLGEKWLFLLPLSLLRVPFPGAGTKAGLSDRSMGNRNTSLVP